MVGFFSGPARSSVSEVQVRRFELVTFLGGTAMIFPAAAGTTLSVPVDKVCGFIKAAEAGPTTVSDK